MKTIAIILAGGSGQRFETKTPKQFIKINKKMIIEYTLNTFQNSSCIDEIIVVTPNEFIGKITKLQSTYPKITKIVLGGATRKESCKNAAQRIDDKEAKILIHNGVQPCLAPQVIQSCVKKLDECDCLSVGVPSVYTIMKLNKEHLVEEICTRDLSYIDLGPECFKLSLLRKILHTADNQKGSEYTNFTAFVKANNLSNVSMIESNRENIKLTHPEDLTLIRYYLKHMQSRKK